MGERNARQLEEALRRRESVERTIARFSSRFVGSLDLDQAINEGLEDLSALSGASRAYVFLFRGDVMDNTHEWCAPAVEPQIDALQGIPLDAVPWWMAALRRGEAVHVRDVAALPPEAASEREILESQDIKSAIAFPIRIGGELVGFVGLDDVAEADSWNADDLRLLDLASDILGSAIQRDRSERERRMSETRFRLLVEQSPISLQVFAPDGQTLRVNRAWERLWGVTLEQLGGYNILEDEQLREKGILAQVERAFAGEAVHLPPVPYVPPSGEHAGQPRWVSAVAYPVKDEAGRVLEVVLMHQDQTEQRNAEAEVAASRQQLAASEKLSSLGALVSGVAHEIRTPLTYISNHVHLISLALARDEKNPLAPRLAEHVAAAREGVDRINRLVEDLRAFARLPAARRVEADLSAVVGRAIHLFRATHRGQVDVAATLSPTPPVLLVPEQVQQVALNLLANAAEAMGNRGSIVVRTLPAEGGMSAELVVEDSGPGLAPEAEQRLFEPFFTTKPEGTGLGLSISRRLVEAHKGSIRYEKAPTGGARFVVRLPATRTKASGAK